MDDADRAQLMEERERDAVIQAALLAKQPVRVVKDGKAICMDCGNELTNARLAAYPNAVRCVICQTEYEGL